MRPKNAVLGLLLVISSSALAQDAFFGIYLEGGKVGYSVVREATPPDAEGLTLSVSETFFRSALLGTDLDMQVTSRTWSNSSGRPVRMEYVTSSSGRKQTLVARFGETEIVAEVDNNGTKTTRNLPIPPGARVVDDATSALVLKGPGSSKSFKVHVLDPTTVTLIENEVTVQGQTKVEVRGKTQEATLVLVRDPRATTRIFYGPDQDVLKIEGPLGMVMLPESEAEAKSMTGNRTDLGFTAAIRLEPGLSRPFDTRELRLKVTGADLTRLPSDAYQTVRREGEGWDVTIHPVAIESAKDSPIVQANRFAQKWLRPSLHVPADDPAMRRLARQIVGNERMVLAAAQKINRWVDANMKENAGIGVLRDANEVIASKEGVCRDFAILAATLMRAAGIPTRLVSGLIYDNGQMYYHAWVEVFSGSAWLMLDPTRADMGTNATRLKLAHGNVEDAFVFTVLEKPRFEVKSVRYR